MSHRSFDRAFFRNTFERNYPKRAGKTTSLLWLRPKSLALPRLARRFTAMAQTIELAQVCDLNIPLDSFLFVLRQPREIISLH